MLHNPYHGALGCTLARVHHPGVTSLACACASQVEAEEIFSSSFAAAAYLEQTKFKETGKKVYIIGCLLYTSPSPRDS